jgi:hypothetical protein
MLRSLPRKSAVRSLYRIWWEHTYGVSSQDIFLVSYPRSGNTWVRFMLLQARPDFREEDFQRIEEIIPDMHGPMPWFRCRRTNLVKSHLTYWQPFRRVVYLVRDGRAATYSNWKYQRDEGKHGLTFAEYLSSPRWPSTWNDHVAGWVAAPETELVIRYEDILSDPRRHLEALCKLLGWPVDSERISRIVEKSSKDRMRSMEQSGGVRLHRVGEGSDSWRDAFNEESERNFVSALAPEAAKFLCHGAKAA